MSLLRRLPAALCALALLVACGAAPAQAAPERKGRATCGKVVKKKAGAKAKAKARSRKAKRCRKPTRRTTRPAAAPTTLPGPAAAPAPTVGLPASDGAPAGPADVAPGEPAAPVAPSLVPAPEPAPAPAPACDLTSPWLGVTAEDADGAFRLRLSRTCVPAGTVRVQLRNRDLQPHNLYAEGVAPAAPRRAVVADLDGEQSTTAAVDLAAGTWRLLCTLPGHEGMTQTVTVQG